MKKLILMLLLALGTAISFQAKAQVNVNINIGAQPQWGPAGYDYVDYYYLPDIESYYYVPKKQFIYMGTGGWVFSHSLPPRYHGYDLYNGYKVVINSPEPYHYFTTHKVKYAKFKGNHGQSVIAKNKGKKYGVGQVKANPRVRSYSSNPKNKQVKLKHAGNGNGKGNHHGNGKGKH